MHGGKNYPFHKVAGTLDVELADGTGDDDYLAALHAALPRVLAASGPDLVVYIAGADPHAGDQLGRLALSFDGLARRSIVVSHSSIVDSTYNRHHCGGAQRLAYDKLEGLVDQAVAAAKSGPEPKFIYVYWPEFDALSHRHGNGSAEVRVQFRAVDAAFAELMQRLAGTDSLVVATADHGFVDSTGADALALADAPGLAGMLRYPLCGESRTAFCHVQAGREREFMRRAAEWLGERAEVRPSMEFAEEGWYGSGDPHPSLAERIGDVTLLMHGRASVLDWTPGERRHRHIGQHGGASEDEILIPLIVGSA